MPLNHCRQSFSRDEHGKANTEARVCRIEPLVKVSFVGVVHLLRD